MVRVGNFQHDRLIIKFELEPFVVDLSHSIRLDGFMDLACGEIINPSQNVSQLLILV